MPKVPSSAGSERCSTETETLTHTILFHLAPGCRKEISVSRVICTDTAEPTDYRTEVMS